MTGTTTNRERSRVSPWPLFIAIGFAISEIGILFGTVPLAVGGILLFGGSCAGIIYEVGYSNSPWSISALIGVLFIGIGGILLGSIISDFSVTTMLTVVSENGVAQRAAVVLVGGVLLLVGGIVGRVWQPEHIREESYKP